MNSTDHYATLKSRMSGLEALLAQLVSDIGPVQFWILTGDGFARCGAQVIPERELMEPMRPSRAAEVTPVVH